MNCVAHVEIAFRQIKSVCKPKSAHTKNTDRFATTQNHFSAQHKQKPEKTKVRIFTKKKYETPVSVSGPEKGIRFCVVISLYHGICFCASDFFNYVFSVLHSKKPPSCEDGSYYARILFFLCGFRSFCCLFVEDGLYNKQGCDHQHNGNGKCNIDLGDEAGNDIGNSGNTGNGECIG